MLTVDLIYDIVFDNFTFWNIKASHGLPSVYLFVHICTGNVIINSEPCTLTRVLCWDQRYRTTLLVVVVVQYLLLGHAWFVAGNPAGSLLRFLHLSQ